MATLTVTGLTKHFETNFALQDVALTVEAGEVRGLLGPNGAGKTTLLRLLLGLVAPQAGNIELCGRAPVAEGGVPDGVAGFVEDPAFYPQLSARANLELLAELDGGDAGLLIDGALARVDLARRADDRVGGFSTGMKKRLGIAASLIRDPRLLLLDEPTAGLDPAGLRMIARMLGDLAADGVAVLISSHQIGELDGVCGTFTVLHGGRVVWDGSRERMTAEAPPSSFLLSTRDDVRAAQLAAQLGVLHPGHAPGEGVLVGATPAQLDELVLALARELLPVRRLEVSASPLESMYFALTSAAPGTRSQAA